MKRQALVMTGFVVGAVVFGCSTGRDESGGSLGSAKSKLSAEQCDYFAVGGKTRICHATASATNPYVILNVASAACVDAHAEHAGDYVGVGDPTCNGQGCLPDGAPSDPTIECCEGLSPRDGACAPTVDLCAGVTCTQACHEDGKCDPKTGRCLDGPVVPDKTPCNTDGNLCTEEICFRGLCENHGPVGCALGIQCSPDTGKCDCTPMEVWPDADGDGFTATDPKKKGQVVCKEKGVPPGYTASPKGLDCDDNDAKISNPVFLWPDHDGDQVTSITPEVFCADRLVEIPAGYHKAPQGQDCDDNDPTVFRTVYLWPDHDGDGFTSPTPEVFCAERLTKPLPKGYYEKPRDADCNDNDPKIWKPTLLCPDLDGDGVGRQSKACVISCERPALYGIGDTDCDDRNPDPRARDADDDGRCDYNDNCPSIPNPDQRDSNNNGIGDACDCPDADLDNVCDAVDNCPTVWNRAQIDTDGDQTGNACQTTCPDGAPDNDLDGLADACDPCPDDATNNCPR